MKKGEIYTGKVVDLKFPNKGMVEYSDENGVVHVCVKGVFPGQTVSYRLTRKKNSNFEGQLIEVVERAPYEVQSDCPHYPLCGGCAYRTIPYEKQLEIKENQVRKLLEKYLTQDVVFEGIKKSPIYNEYRNKMEFSFGDCVKDGPLELGLHKSGSFYDIISVKNCRIADADMRAILSETLSYFRGKDTKYYHKRTHEGFLRHLLIRKAVRTGEILVDIVTTSQTPPDGMCTEISLMQDWKEAILGLKLTGKIVGVLHTVNDSVADSIINEKTDILYGQDYFLENILGLTFKITPFSFFQTNSLSAEVLYSTARDFIVDAVGEDGLHNNTVFDLYSGTGTIAQIIAPVTKRVIGIEIVEEAVVAARMNAELNGLHNCEFVAGDVLKMLDEIEEKPGFIILDPPRDGINPKALKKIMDYGVENIVYISCKPTSLARDLEMFTLGGYKVKRVCCVDQFPMTPHVETVCLLSKLHEAKHHVNVKLDMDELDLTSAGEEEVRS